MRMEAINDFEFLEKDHYSTFDQSAEREKRMAEMFQRMLNPPPPDPDLEDWDFSDTFVPNPNFLGQLNFRGKQVKEEDEYGDTVRHLLYGSSRIAAQFKTPRGYLLIMDLHSKRNVFRLPGFELMFGTPNVVVIFFTFELRPVYAYWLSGRCVQRRLWSKTRPRRKCEAFNPIPDWIIVDDWTVDIRMLGRGWLRIKIDKVLKTGYSTNLAIPYEVYPYDRRIFNPSFGPHYFFMRPCFRLRMMNDASLITILLYLLRGPRMPLALWP